MHRPVQTTLSASPGKADHSAAFVRLPETDEAITEPAAQLAGTLLIELPNETVIRVSRSFTLDEVFQAAARLDADKSSY